VTKKIRLKRFIFALLRVSGVPYLLREIMQRNRVTILAYHKPSPEITDQHLEVLRQKYNFISLSEYIKFRMQPEQKLPPKALIVTFDDGHKTNYGLKSVLEKHGVRATFFVCSGLVDTNRGFWFETEMSDSLRQKLKHVPDDERLEVLADLGFTETGEQSIRQSLSTIEINEMRPIADFQSHTVYHPLLPRCSATRAAAEIFDSKVQLEKKFGATIYALAYPNGDYSPREIAAAEASGYQCALTLNIGFNSRQTPAFELRRICIDDNDGITELLVKTSGLWGSLRNFIRAGASGWYRRRAHTEASDVRIGSAA
jgi:peptidoglycan/xylan/chitin deacetylase (PgdA/CDA1 family)